MSTEEQLREALSQRASSAVPSPDAWAQIAERVAHDAPEQPWASPRARQRVAAIIVGAAMLLVATGVAWVAFRPPSGGVAGEAQDVESTVNGVTLRYPETWTAVDLWPLAAEVATWPEPSQSISLPEDAPERGGLPLLQVSNIDLGLRSACGIDLVDTEAVLYVAMNGGPYRVAPGGAPVWGRRLAEADGPCGPGLYAYRAVTLTRDDGSGTETPYFVYAGFGPNASSLDREAIFRAADSMRLDVFAYLSPPVVESPSYVIASELPTVTSLCDGEAATIIGDADEGAVNADQAQLQGDQLDDVMVDVMGAISQARMCEFWSLMLPDEIAQEHPWPDFAEEWRSWLDRQDFSDVELGSGDWMTGKLRWALVGSVGDDATYETYIVEVLHDDAAIARLTLAPLPDHCPDCGGNVVPFWGVIGWDLDPEVAATPEAAFGWCPAGPFPEAGDRWREESADAAVRFVDAYSAGDDAALAAVLDGSVPPGTSFPVIADAEPVGFNAAGGTLVREACGADVDAYSVAVTMGDQTVSASMDFTVYLVFREDGWKIWAIY